MNDIIPGQSINGFQLNWSKEELLSHLDKNKISIEDLKNDNLIIHYDLYKFWIDLKSNQLFQIGAYNGYKGNFQGIGIGSTLTDVKQKFGNWSEETYTYTIPKYSGMCFELADNDIDEEWIQESAPIEAIYVYKPQK